MENFFFSHKSVGGYEIIFTLVFYYTVNYTLQGAQSKFQQSKIYKEKSENNFFGGLMKINHGTYIGPSSFCCCKRTYIKSQIVSEHA